MGLLETVMKQFLLITFLFLVACKSQVLPPAVHETTEVVRIEYREILRDTTVYIQLPPEIRERVTRDTVSTLETSLAISTAMWSGGFLHHSIINRDTTLPVQIVYRDVVQIRDSVSRVFISEPYAVPAEFSKWQSFFMMLGRGVFWLSLIAGMFFVSRKYLKKYLLFLK